MCCGAWEGTDSAQAPKKRKSHPQIEFLPNHPILAENGDKGLSQSPRAATWLLRFKPYLDSSLLSPRPVPGTQGTILERSEMPSGQRSGRTPQVPLPPPSLSQEVHS